MREADTMAAWLYSPHVVQRIRAIEVAVEVVMVAYMTVPAAIHHVLPVAFISSA